MQSIHIAELRAGDHYSGFAIAETCPKLSWRFKATAVKGWRQGRYEIIIARNGKEEHYTELSSDSINVPWPSSPLRSREVAQVKVRAIGEDESSTRWASLTVEVALLDRDEWIAKLISRPLQDLDQPKRPFLVRKNFQHVDGRCRLYATAHGMYQVEINGVVVGDQCLTPGWQSYHHRLHYQTYDVTGLLQPGTNVIGAYVGEGWFAGRLGRPGISNIWGERPAFLAQLEVDGKPFVVTDSSWEYLYGPVTNSEIYNGEAFDTTIHDHLWSTTSTTTKPVDNVDELAFPSAQLIAPHVAPVRRIMEIKPQSIFKTRSEKTILDFGQNIAGWIRVDADVQGSGVLVIKYAEVMENGELGTRPLRTARARTMIQLGGRSIKGYEPRFTWYGFRYAEVDGHDNVRPSDYTAIVISSDLRRTGTFDCSHEKIKKLHENTVWSMRGNFISVPTDCPQRDERLGWTGDIQVFATTANYLFDTSSFLRSWLEDLKADQKDMNGVVPVVVPMIPIPPRHPERRPMAAWGDAAILTPWDIYTFYGDVDVLKSQWTSMRSWLEKGIPRGPDGFYSMKSPQYGDWLDPRSPPHLPGHSPTDQYLIANAYLIKVTSVTATIGKLLGENEVAAQYEEQAKRLCERFSEEYVTRTGRVSSDSQAAYAICLAFDLIQGEKERETCKERLRWLIQWESFRITTGFVGTPMILKVLADNDMLSYAYRMLQEQDEPSWLYPVSMGATTIVCLKKKILKTLRPVTANVEAVGTMELNASGRKH